MLVFNLIRKDRERERERKTQEVYFTIISQKKSFMIFTFYFQEKEKWKLISCKKKK